MQNLRGMIWVTSQSLISARSAKNAYQYQHVCRNAYQYRRHNDKVSHQKQVYSQILQYFVLILHGYFSLTMYDK
jgi:hypothetical protein